ncbi:MAG TPA: hypothetical protein VEF72_06475 [Mycobacterium sp.]|nr:hypothetical protein [Mycobacterium sp.]
MAGTPSERFVPFGAFRRLIDITADIGRPVRCCGRSATLFTREHAKLLLIVDDVHELDS